MANYLFRGNAHEYWEQRYREISLALRSTPDKELLSLPVSEILNKLSGQFAFTVAKLNPQERRGKRRTVTREVNDYGEIRERNSPLLMYLFRSIEIRTVLL